MGELGAFPIFVSRKGSFKSPQNPRDDFFKGKKRLRRIQNEVFPFTVIADFFTRWKVY